MDTLSLSILTFRNLFHPKKANNSSFKNLSSISSDTLLHQWDLSLAQINPKAERIVLLILFLVFRTFHSEIDLFLTAIVEVYIHTIRTQLGDLS